MSRVSEPTVELKVGNLVSHRRRTTSVKMLAWKDVGIWDGESRAEMWTCAVCVGLLIGVQPATS